MTTAARPTFEPARGGTGKGEGDLSALSKQYSSRDLPAHKELKYRQKGQSTNEEIRSRDFRRELEDRERSVKEKRDRGRESGSSKKARLEHISSSNLDADEPVDDDDEDESDSDDSDDDDTAALLAELSKIKKERALEQQKKEVEKAAEEERIRMENIIKGNPLLQSNQYASDYKVKRRWDDDVVFKNCAKGDENSKKGFINDALRNEFHKKFMEKYVK